MKKYKVSEKEVSSGIKILQRLVWSDKDTREKIQEFGVNVVPSNFYSSTPSIQEIESSFEYGSSEPPYISSHIFNEVVIQQTLEKIINFSVEFNPIMEGNEDNCKAFYWKNSQFSYSDAMSYYCFIRHLKPSNIVEIGSGFSTLVALDAIEKNGSGQLFCIEPYPREFLKNETRVNLRCDKAQDIHVEYLNDTLQDGDIFFIDSTHTVKTGSDCLHIYLRLLPEIKRNIYVHVHDIFLPFGMPKEWLLNQHIYWTEQYLLLAFLIGNPNASLVYGSAYNAYR